MKNITAKHRILATVVILIVLAALFAAASSVFRRNGGAQTVSVRSGELVKTVKVSGKVVPSQSASLGFQVGGTVSDVYKDAGDRVSKGDAIVDLDKASVQASLLKAQADLAAARAELAKLQGGATASTQLSNATADTVQAIYDGYTTADDAVRSKGDQLFKDPRTSNPSITFFFGNSDDRTALNQRRIAIEGQLVAWKGIIADLDVGTFADQKLNRSLYYLQSIATFLDQLASAVSDYKASDLLPQSTIDKYKADLAAARSNVNGAISAIIAKNNARTDIASSVPVQVAKVAAAEATVAGYQAELGNTSIKAPFSGVVSKQDAKVGEAVSPNAALVSLISTDFKIEAYVPEVSIAGIAIGNTATVTLDAYGSSADFPAKVSHIDPAETVRDGVSNYRIELSFLSPDDRIRSGMTANVTIETLRKEGALIVPSRSILAKDGVSTVLLKTEDGSEGRQIETGIVDSEGNTEVVSGLSEGDAILLDPTAGK